MKGREASRLSQELADRVRAPTPGAEGMVGLEHEYSLSDSGRQVDFRSLIHRLELGRPNLDPGDPNAYRMRSGSVWTCDGREAEIALPPSVRGGRFGATMARRAAQEETSLRRALPGRLRLQGCSTHISVSAPDSMTHAAAAMYARTFAPAMMLMLDGPGSPGLLVRPRPGRVELCGEYLAGDRLAAAISFAVGSVMACLAALGGRQGGAHTLPPVLAVMPEPARERYGWYIDRRAFGPDLYVAGRGTTLELAGGGWTSGQRQLELSWESARIAIEPHLEPEDAAQVDALVAGTARLPIEAPVFPHSPATSEGPLAPPEPDPDVDRVLCEIRRPGFALAPVMATWDTMVLLVLAAAGAPRAFMSLPAPALPAFGRALSAGDLDDVLLRYLAVGSSRRRLRRRADALRVGLHDSIGPRRSLLPLEPAGDRRATG